MSTATNRTTASQLAAMKDDGQRYELVEGELRMMSPAGGLHGWIALRLGRLLGAHVDENGLGAVFAAETGFLIASNPDTVRAPDVAFVSSSQLSKLDGIDGYLPISPDLVVEVVSPNDSSTDVEAKAEMWIEAGTRMVLVVDPSNRSIRVYRDKHSIEVLHIGDELDAGDIVNSWALKVADAFPQ